MPPISGLDTAARSLVKQCMCINPWIRMTVDEAVSHEFFQEVDCTTVSSNLKKEYQVKRC